MADWVILQSPEFRDWYRTSLTDEERDAIIATALRLLGGDKTDNWADWYKANIPIADAIYERHLAGLAEAAPSRQPERRKRGRKR